MITDIRENLCSNFCKVSFDGGTKWVYGIITQINQTERICDIFLSSNFLNDFFEVGDNVTVRSLSDVNELIFDGNVLKKTLSPWKQSLTIQINNFTLLENFRINERFEINYPAIVTTFGNEKITAILNDISFNGMNLYVKNPLQENDTIHIEVFLTSHKSFDFDGIIKHCLSYDTGYNLGVYIENISEESGILLENLLDFLKSDKKRIHAEYNIFSVLKYSRYFIFFLISLTTILMFFIIKLLF